MNTLERRIYKLYLTIDFSNFIPLLAPTTFRMSQHDRDQDFGEYLN